MPPPLRASVLLWLAACARAYLLTPSSRHAAPRCAPLRMQEPAWEPPVVPLQHVQPSPTLTPRDVVNSVMSALHRTNWDTPTPYYGFEVALRFLAPTHMAKLNNAKPGGYARYMRQPHKVGQITWNEFRFEGDVILLEGGSGPDEVPPPARVGTSARVSVRAGRVVGRGKLRHTGQRAATHERAPPPPGTRRRTRCARSARRPPTSGRPPDGSSSRSTSTPARRRLRSGWWSSWWKRPSTLSEDSAASAHLVAPTWASSLLPAPTRLQSRSEACGGLSALPPAAPPGPLHHLGRPASRPRLRWRRSSRTSPTSTATSR